MTLRIVPVDDERSRRRFIAFPYRLHRKDPSWVPPLHLQMKEQFDERRQPFLRHARTRLLLAERDGRVVGRMSAHYDTRQTGGTASFGFFDAADDPEAAQALVAAASKWAEGEGHDRIQGPYSWTTHDPLGILVEGFDWPPMLMMGHNPPYYDELLKGAGLRKKKDLFAYRFDVGDMPRKVMEEYEESKKNERLVIRKVDMKRFEDEIRVVVKIYNEAWKDNWGFTPITERELRAIANGLKPIVDPEIVLIAEVDGEPAGMAVAVPNLNEAIADLGGRLVPFGWARLLWRLKVRGTKTARMMLLGILPEHRGAMSRAILMGLYGRLHQVGTANGYEWGELSWTLEDNDAINRSIERLGSLRYKTYRLYEAKV